MKIGGSIFVGLLMMAVILSSVALHPGLSTNEFCVSCHEMEKPLAEYQATTHFSSASGVRAECSSCHIPEPIGPRLFAKIDALRHVYGHLRGTLATDQMYEDARLRMAERVWEHYQETDSRECRACHKQDSFSFDMFDSHSSAQTMSSGLEEGKTCIDCHKGLVHPMPDLSSGYKVVLRQLEASSADPDVKTDMVYPLETIPAYSSKGGEQESRILSATGLSVLENDGDWLKVRVEGWRQDGIDAMIYELQGKRIFAVALDKNSRQKPVTHSSMFDEDTEQSWHRVSYEAWVSNAKLVQDKDKLWEYGKKLHSGTCGACHMAVPAEQYLANQWIGVMKDMKRNIRHLSTEQYRFLQKYLQLNAKDVKGDQTES